MSYFVQISPFDGSMLPYKLERKHDRVDTLNPSTHIPSRHKDNVPIPRTSAPSFYSVKSARHPDMHYRPQRPGTNLPTITSPQSREADAAMARLERMLGI